MEGITWIEQQCGFGVDEGGACDPGYDFALVDAYASLEDAANDTFLSPDLSFLEFAIGVETRELRTGTGAARGAVVGFTRAKDKIPTMAGGIAGWSKDFDVIDLTTVGSCNAILLQRLT